MDKNGKRPEKEDEADIDLDFGIGRIFGNLKTIIDAVSELSGGEIRKETHTEDARGRIKYVRGFSVRTLGDTTSIEGFGNRIKKDQKDGEMVVEKVREPIVDVFDEGGHLVVVAEMPGVEEKDIRVRILGDILQIEAKSDQREYEKEILLPFKVEEAPAKNVFLNGVLELKLRKVQEGSAE